MQSNKRYALERWQWRRTCTRAGMTTGSSAAPLQLRSRLGERTMAFFRGCLFQRHRRPFFTDEAVPARTRQAPGGAPRCNSYPP